MTSEPNPKLRIGTAGWAIPRAHAAAFPAEGSGLARYAARFDAAEINSSFHRPHRPATYARWAATVPEGFRFSVKLPRTITHERRLVDAAEPLERFLAEAAALGPTLAVLLVQLPPSLAFDAAVAEAFFRTLHDRADAALTGKPRLACETIVVCETSVVCEPRHPTWFTPEADALLCHHRIARVAADPPRVPEAAEPGGLPKPGGWPGLVYVRLHGSPVMYRSSYDPAYLDALAAQFRRHPEEARSAVSNDEQPGRAGRLDTRAETWCIFDNTTLGAAADNAIELTRRIAARA